MTAHLFKQRENKKKKTSQHFFMHNLNFLVPLGRLENEKRCNLIILCWFCMKTTFYNEAIAFSKWKTRNNISVSILNGGKEWMHVEKERNDGWYMEKLAFKFFCKNAYEEKKTKFNWREKKTNEQTFVNCNADSWNGCTGKKLLSFN